MCKASVARVAGWIPPSFPFLDDLYLPTQQLTGTWRKAGGKVRWGKELVFVLHKAVAKGGTSLAGCSQTSIGILNNFYWFRFAHGNKPWHLKLCLVFL